MSDVETMREVLDSEEFEFRYDTGIGQSSRSMRMLDRDRIFELIASILR